MKRSTLPALSLLGLALPILVPAAGWGQTVTATVPVGHRPVAIALNQVTNKIYVASCPTTPGAQPGENGTVSVIDGGTNSTTTVLVGICPTAIAVNSVTNKIYVANFGKICLISNSCNNAGRITVIDGMTNSTAEVELPQPNLPHPRGIAVNTTTNKIYVANHYSSNVAAIDGSTNAVTMIPTAGLPYDVAVNLTTNRIYISSFDSIAYGTKTIVTEIDGESNATVPVIDPKAAEPIAVAVNPVTNKIYVANIVKDGTNVGSITVIDGATNSTTNLIDPNAFSPHAVAVNPVSNKIYIANADSTARSGNGGVTVIDGATDSLTTIADPNAQTGCDVFSTANVAVDPTRNLIYVANCNNVTAIDGATNLPVTVTDPSAAEPIAVAVNPQTNKIYVVNSASSNVTVIDGGAGTMPEFTLSATAVGNGSGRITSNPAGIDCRTSCNTSFAAGATVTLIASPDDSGSTFSGWSGACSGSGNCAITMSANESVTAAFAATQDFTINVGTTSLTVNQGGHASEALTFATQGGFSGIIALACSVSGPAGMPTCGISPPSVRPGDNATLTINAGAFAAEMRPPTPMGLWAAWLLLGLMGYVLAASFNKKGRRVQFAYLLIMAVTVPIAACGGGNQAPSPAAQHFTVTVTATSATIQHTTTVSLTVQ